MTVTEFERAWWAFVARWVEVGGADSPAGAAAETDVLAHGVEPVAASMPEPSEPSEADALACEIALVRRAGAVDEDAYRFAFPEVAGAVEDPVRHFCQFGWRAVFNPRPDFDLWWYWSEHLDPTRVQVNPLLHHLLAGERAGLPTLPALVADRVPTAPSPTRPVRRACLFAGYDPDGIVDDYVVDFVAELARHADVFYLADCTLGPDELAKLEPHTVEAWSIRHGLYDFGSWSRLAIELVGWDRLAAYDEVIFANDSSYLLRPLDELFARMDATACDWWGLHPTRRPYSRDTGATEPLPLAEATARWSRTNDVNPVDHLHLSSYLLAFRRPVLDDPGFRRRLEAVTAQTSKTLVILKYELGLSRYLFTQGFQAGAFIDELYPFLPVYTSDVWELVERGFPVLKRNLLSENTRNMPGLDRWQETVRALVPGAAVDTFERNLVRVTPDDQRRRSFSVQRRPDGTVDFAFPLTWARFREEDRWIPKFDHWWAFPVCALDHTLAGNERAVFEEVREDPSIKKIVLTRSRPFEVRGENVVVVPLMSREGQHHLLRARQIFVKHGPTINAHWPLSPLVHNFVNLWHGIPLKRFGSASVEISKPLEKSFARNNGACRAVVSSSRIDSLAMTNAFWPMAYPDVWNTGLPRNDYVTCPPERLPADLRATEDRLRDELGGRRLVMFLPTYKESQAAAYYRFTAAELDWLAGWMERHDVVLGVREHMADRARTYWHQLAPLGCVDLSNRRFPDLEVLYRVADGLVSDYSSCLVDFLLTGRPVASFAYDLRHYSEQERGLFYDLTKVLPGPVCETFEDLAAALDRFFDPGDASSAEEYAWRRRVFFDHVDDQASRRVVERVKGLYGTASAG